MTSSSRSPRKGEAETGGAKSTKLIEPVTTPTRWISSMVKVVKNGKLRIGLDPRPLSKAIQREHSPLPTIEDVATGWNVAKVFTRLDVRKGFWHVKLDED